MKKSKQISLKLFLAALIWIPGLSVHGQGSGQGQGNDWEFVVAPYLFMGSLSGDATVGVAGPAEVDLNFGDILKKLQFAFMIRGEVYKGDWGLIADYLYLKLGDDIDGPVGIIRDIEIKQGIFELFLSRRFRQDWGWFDIYAGIRSWDFGLRLNLEGLDQVSAVNFNQNWVDPVVGGRIFYKFSDRFLAGLRADIGGFGAGSDFTYTLQPGVGYHFSDWFTLMLQYKYLHTDYSNDEEGLDFFAFDAGMNGPLLGLVFKF
ncbi:MAG: hypothetical protein ACO20F_12165 [Robiginitalea sp.]|jgi:hypothetical protein